MEKCAGFRGAKRLVVRSLWLICLLVLVKTHPANGGKIVIDGDDQFSYARSLMDATQYEEAVAEFRRFIHFFSEDPKVPLARYLIGVSYLRAGRFETARNELQEVARSHPDSVLCGKALFMIGESYYLQEVFTEAEYYFTQVIERYPHSELKPAALYRLGWAKMQTGRWKDASESFEAVEPSSIYYQSARSLAAESKEGEHLAYKDPTTAGVLAAIVPGSGHAYVGRYKDATVAFLVNALFIWAAVESFQEDHHVLGGILTFLEVGWYTGNIYSAVNVAHKHNRKVKRDFLNRMKDQLEIRPFSSAEGRLGLALNLTF